MELIIYMNLIYMLMNSLLDFMDLHLSTADMLYFCATYISILRVCLVSIGLVRAKEII